MPLNLIIENMTSLPDGGPLAYTFVGTGTLVIGRDQYLDWTLPDPNRAISGKHCEIRWRDGAYWLHDLSRNGTFVNQTTQRLTEPQRLHSGDRLYIGHYIVRAHVDGEGPVEPAEPTYPRHQDQRRTDFWDGSGDAAPYVDPRSLQPPPPPRHDDFPNHVIDLPTLRPGGAGSVPSLPDLYGDSAGGGDWMAETPTPTRGGAGASIPTPTYPGPVPPPGQGQFDDGPWGAPSLGIGDRSARTEPRGSTPEPDFTMPGASPTPPPQPPAPRRGPDGFIERFAKGAGIAPEVLEWRDPGDLAEELGALTRLSVENLKQLLAARAEAKRVARASSQTMIQALDNNPLKFTPTTEDALRILLGRPTSGYLTGRRALDEGFRDLKTHQVKVYSAMQHALRLLLQDLDPDAVEASMGDDKGLGALLGSRKARLWDLYATRWDAMTAPHEDGMVDAFMVFFAECYDRGAKG